MPKWLPAAAAIAPDKVLFASLLAYSLSSKTSILSLVLSSSFFRISTSSFASRTALAAAAACRFHLQTAMVNTQCHTVSHSEAGQLKVHLCCTLQAMWRLPVMLKLCIDLSDRLSSCKQPYLMTAFATLVGILE